MCRLCHKLHMAPSDEVSSLPSLHSFLHHKQVDSVGGSKDSSPACLTHDEFHWKSYPDPTKSNHYQLYVALSRILGEGLYFLKMYFW